MKNKFSIITAAYNNERFLKDYFASVLSQKYANMEIIFVDDCSTDGTWDFLNRIKDKRLKKIRNSERLYCSSAYNVALSHATGNICGVVDGDDIIVPNAINHIMDLYNRYRDVEYIYTQHWWCDVELNKKRRGLSSLPPKGKSFVDMAFKKVHCFSHWRTFKRHLAKKATLFPEGLKYTVDKNLGFILEELGKGGYYDQPLYRYRYYKGNMSLQYGKQQKMLWQELASKFDATRKKKNKKVYPVVQLKS